MKENDQLIIKATCFSLAVALIIVLAKLFAWYYTDSTVILASFADSMLDIAASFINLIASRYALQPPDNDHRFGHGKAEDLAVFSQSSFFIISGVFVLGVSIKKLIVPTPLENDKLGIITMAFSILLTIFLILYQNYAYKRTKSKIIKADRLHYSVDLLSNLAVIIALFLSKYLNNPYIDPIFAIGIAGYIIFEALKLLSSAFRNLMDHEMEEKDRKKIKSIIMANKKVKGFHDLKTRYSGRKPVIQFHIELDSKMPLYEAHEIAEDLEVELYKAFKKADIIIHQDPYGESKEVNFVS